LLGLFPEEEKIQRLKPVFFGHPTGPAEARALIRTSWLFPDPRSSAPIRGKFFGFPITRDAGDLGDLARQLYRIRANQCHPWNQW
jgi:hypothetical protein